MKVVYQLNEDEIKLPEAEIRNGIIRFEDNAHFVDNTKATYGIFRHVKGAKLKNTRPLGHASPSWLKRTLFNARPEPFYVLSWRYIQTANAMKDGKLEYRNEEKYKLSPSMLETMLDLKLDQNLINHRGFNLNRKTLIILLGIAGAAIIAYLFFTGHLGVPPKLR